jgi:hypothetical protein
MLDGALEHLTCLGKAVAGVKQTVDLHAVLGPLPYFVEIAIVGNVGLSVPSWKSTLVGFGSFGMVSG